MGSGNKYLLIEDEEGAKLVILPPFIEIVHAIVVGL
jgi:hypothetical protein